MKKKTIAWMMAASLFGAGGCSAENSVAQKLPVEPGKILIATYSWGGNTRFVAEQIQKQTGGTLFEIKPADAYPSDYNACVEQAKKECREEFQPKLSETVENFDQYEVIFVGTPNWWSTIAPPVRTFLSSYDFSGKTVIPFVTHGGGGMAGCERDMQKLCPQAKFVQGKAFSGGSVRNSEKAIAEWIDEIVSIRP